MEFVELSVPLISMASILQVLILLACIASAPKFMHLGALIMTAVLQHCSMVIELHVLAFK